MMEKKETKRKNKKFSKQKPAYLDGSTGLGLGESHTRREQSNLQSTLHLFLSAFSSLLLQIRFSIQKGQQNHFNRKIEADG